MKLIKTLVMDIKDELAGAEHYAKLAVQYKDEDKILAENYAKMSEVELSHVNLLHAQVTRIIKEWKAANGKETPAAIQIVWDWEHEQMIDRIAGIKVLLATYRGS